MSAHQGIELVWDPAQSDNRVYTLILKDELLPPNPENGRQRSTVSWEYDFCASGGTAGGGGVGPGPLVCFIPWTGLKPTYRGKPKDDTSILDVSSVKRISIMIRRCVFLPEIQPITRPLKDPPVSLALRREGLV